MSVIFVKIYCLILFAVIVVSSSCVSLKNSPSSSSKNIISAVSGRVIIDAGHGGEDAGAVGTLGLKEKDVSLDIALRIRRWLRKIMPKVDVVLTRKTDSFVSLEERVKTANSKGGDLFLSLHINSSDDKDASGFELYSLDVASNAHADRLANRENKSGGNGSHALKFVLADLRASANRAESDQLAALISRGLHAQLPKVIPSQKLNNRGYNQALFYVLFVRMPAVLSEIFFISNTQEERMLADRKVREHIARGMVLGIKKYLENRVIRAQK
ncbi:MAG: N-acetylmuramoyl-L-alanine amidase [Myxococcales bacterium]|nr:N-acetylmuramoyl-L-alanine amidase [Myxococcales bacterium]USN50134.1 MAG: N-acetylmuramoyl-L-alanine amidase [Myxococcales bacterium]